MFGKPEQRPVRTSNLSSDIAAYIINKRSGISSGKIPAKNNTSQPAPVPVQPNNETRPKPNPVNKNIRLVNKTGTEKALEYQILFGELENMLLTMNHNDATVQRALIKLNEIRTRVLPELRKT
jgi:hypothetical protein